METGPLLNAYKLKVDLKMQGRCPICTFKPPCSHYSSSRAIPKIQVPLKREAKPIPDINFRIKIHRNFTPSKKVEIKTGFQMLQTIQQFRQRPERSTREIPSKDQKKTRSKSWNFDDRYKRLIHRFYANDKAKLKRGLVGQSVTLSKFYSLS